MTLLECCEGSLGYNSILLYKFKTYLQLNPTDTKMQHKKVHIQYIHIDTHNNLELSDKQHFH